MIARPKFSSSTPRSDRQTGFGLGLRSAHYADFLRERQAVDWLEIITDNFLGDGGRPLVMLERIRQDYPVAMHGVAMSIGGTDPLDLTYLQKVNALAQRIEPLWVSDHLCWTGHYQHRLHDLYPLPYTEEAARHVVDRIRQAQDILCRRLVIENVSSYIDFADSTHTEWAFLRHVANEADCLLLVDVNNVFVSSVNHGFDPLTYLQGLPAERVQQIHLAGHTDHGDHLIDTHDHPVCQAVWRLYAQACSLYGPVATMIERDDQIPPLPELLDELALARRWRAGNGNGTEILAIPAPPVPDSNTSPVADPAVSLNATQIRLTQYILNKGSASGSEPSNEDTEQCGMSATETTDPNGQASEPSQRFPGASPSSGLTACHLVRTRLGTSVAQRLGIYHHAYRARLAEALADSFERTAAFAGGDEFAAWATEFAEQQPPNSRSLNHYGEALPGFLRKRFAHNPELFELAQLDWDLRSRFDMADSPSLDSALACELPPEAWLQTNAPLHPTVLLRGIQTNVVALWQALDADDEVPAPKALHEPMGLVVWRQGEQPHFQSLPWAQWQFMAQLAAGHSLLSASEAMASQADLSAQTLGSWFEEALTQGWLRQGAQAMPTSN